MKIFTTGPPRSAGKPPTGLPR